VGFFSGDAGEVSKRTSEGETEYFCKTRLLAKLPLGMGASWGSPHVAWAKQHLSGDIKVFKFVGKCG
jgi:hypothetical protein